ncbi:MFS transporter [Bordetella tumulicola]|uniref:MFS transporter n=1 Tax=Bordetella tumulicola TaxID=1649133 RepID=UPI0039F0D1BB
MSTASVLPQSGFFGVWVVRAAFVLAMFGWGVGFYGPAIYLAQVITRTGWSLEMVSVAVTVHFLFGAIVVANLPRLHAWMGLAPSIALGAVCTAIGVLGWAVVWQPWQLFVVALVGGAGWVMMGAVAVTALVSRWYAAGRPVALGKAYNGASIGGAVFAPLWVALIQGLGFPGAAALVGVVMVVVVAGLSVTVFSQTPERQGQSVDGYAGAVVNVTPAASAGKTDAARPAALPGKALWRDRAFLTLAIGMAIGLFAQIGLLAHLFKLLVPTLGAQNAGLLMGGGTACAIVGRAVAARAITYVGDRRVIAAASYGMQAVGSAVLLFASPDGVWPIVLGVALVGAGIGNATSLPPLIAQTDFATRDVPRVVALIVAMSQGTYAFGPAVFGLLQHSSAVDGPMTIGPDSRLLFATALVIQVMAAAVYLAGRRRGSVDAKRL